MKVKRKLSRLSIEVLSIRSACEFCRNMGLTPSIANISMVTGFSEEKILERIDADFQVCRDELVAYTALTAEESKNGSL
jgi:phosphotransacetylase